MLIEFKVSNFLSIKDEQRLSMVASADKTHGESLIDPNLPGLKGLKFVKCAAIYGANASGKSNLIKALAFIRQFVLDSATKLKPGHEINATPFLFDKVSQNEKSKFELTFVCKGIRYVFGFSLNRFRVLEEYLVAYPKGLPQTWYHREYVGEEYKWSGSETGLKRSASLRDKTRPNCLFLSVGPQFNHEQLTEVYNWFQDGLAVVSLHEGKNSPNDFSKSILEIPELKEAIVGLLRNADLGIVNAEVIEEEVSLDMIGLHLPPDHINRLSQEPVKIKEVRFFHKTGEGEECPLNYENESDGTRKLFSISGPWLTTLKGQSTVVIDELETSLHPLIVEELLKLLHDPKRCPGAAQVIFSTHSPLLLSANILRRDQIWFTEKNGEGATQLYPLTDFKPRKDESLAKGYLAGRFGAIPFIPAGLCQ